MSDNYGFESWGRYPKVPHLGELIPKTTIKVKDILGSIDASVLPRGMGRSYGDSCLNEDGYLLSVKQLNKFIQFDHDTGILRCESGVTLEEILKVFVPKGWFLPVTPGTKYVTVGGAIANDIHGKNHHKAGTFSRHVSRFELQRSDGGRLLCSRDSNTELFRATVGGLGLTGVILWADLQLKQVKGPYVDMESVKFESFDEFMHISRESEEGYEYTVSWIDCLNSESLKGIFMRGNHSVKVEHDERKLVHSNPTWKTFPVDAPSFLLSTWSVKLFNFLYYSKQGKKYHKSTVHYDPFFYPLDSINQWNRMYGKRGFLQWQCVVPRSDNNEGIRSILDRVTKSKLGSFLVVLKEFGDLPSEGMLSFPIPGITLAIDLPNVGDKLFLLLNKLDEIVLEVGGRIYPAKDARMSRKTFTSSFTEYDNFAKHIDLKMSSSFIRRVGREL